MNYWKKRRLILQMFMLALLFLCLPLHEVLPETAVRDLILGQGLPAKIKSKKKIARWDQIDEVLNVTIIPRAQKLSSEFGTSETQRSEQSAGLRREELRKGLAASGILFSDLFQIIDGDFFPLTNSVVKLVPESSLEGVAVFDKSGQVLGTFVGKTRYERTGSLYGRRSYVLMTFEYQTPGGDLRSAGNDNLLDNYLVRWSDIKARPAMDLAFVVAP